MKKLLLLWIVFFCFPFSSLYGQSATSTIHWVNTTYKDSKGVEYIRICVTDDIWGMKGRKVYFKVQIYFVNQKLTGCYRRYTP